MPWRGIDALVDAYGRMRYRVRMASARLAVRGAEVIRENAQLNILASFTQHTGALYRSMFADPVATALGPNDFTARAFPKGPPDGTPYGRIQELGGIIVAHNPTGYLWFDALRNDGSYGLISVPEVEIPGMFYLRDAVLYSIPQLRQLAAGIWEGGVEG